MPRLKRFSRRTGYSGAKPEPPAKKKRKKYTADSPTRLTPDTLKRVKRSTVYIRVGDGRGEGGTGSGFFAYEPGIVLTNAHVVGMMEADSLPPRRIDVILNSGEPDERNLTGDVVAVSTPLRWSEVRRGLRPERFTIQTMARRIDKVGDLWEPINGAGVDLAKCLERLAKP